MQAQRVVFDLVEDELYFVRLKLDSAGAGVYGASTAPALGSGRFGTVRKGYILSAAEGRMQPCALKQLSLKDNDVRQVEHECQMLRAVEDIPGTVKCLRPPIYTAGIGAIVTEFIPGKTLHTVLQQQSVCHAASQSSDFQPKCKILYQLFSILQQLHAKDIVHRDVKPANVMITPNMGSLHLIDFGLAEFAASGMVSGYRGTLFYMAPEQLLHHIRHQQSSSSSACKTTRFDGRAADVWAAGMVAFEVLTGCKPFPSLMNEQESNAEQARPKQVRMQHLAQAYEAWERQWHDRNDARWLKLLECSSPMACFFVRQALRFQPHMRATASQLLHFPFLQLSVLSPRAQAATAADQPALSSQVTTPASRALLPVAGLPDMLWNPEEGPVQTSLTGPIFRCFSKHTHDSAAFLVKMTQLLDQDYLGKPAHTTTAEPDFARAEELVDCLNHEVDVWYAGQAACSIPTTSIHLSACTSFLTMRLDQAASDADIMTLQTFVDTRLCGGSVHPYGIQLLAQRLLKALIELHEDEWIMGVMHPETIAMAPDVYVTDFSYGAVEDCDWPLMVMGPVEHMAPETLRAVLQQPQLGQEPVISSASDMFSLGVLLKGLALGYLPFAHSRQRSCTLSQKTALKRAKSIAKQHRQWQGYEDTTALEEVSVLQQEAISFANSLMSPELSRRPSAAVALAHPFLSPQSIAQAEADMRHCLPGYSQQKHVLPVLPKRSWNIGALHHAASVLPDESSVQRDDGMQRGDSVQQGESVQQSESVQRGDSVQLSVPVPAQPAANIGLSLQETRCSLPAKRKTVNEPGDCNRSDSSSTAALLMTSAAAWSRGSAPADMGSEGHEQHEEATQACKNRALASAADQSIVSEASPTGDPKPNRASAKEHVAYRAGPSAVPQWSRLQQSPQPYREHADNRTPLATSAAAAAAAEVSKGATAMHQPSVLDKQVPDHDRTAEHLSGLHANQPAVDDVLPVSHVVIIQSSMHEMGYGQAQAAQQIQPQASIRGKQQQQLAGTLLLAAQNQLDRTSTASPCNSDTRSNDFATTTADSSKMLQDLTRAGEDISHPMDVRPGVDSSSLLGQSAAAQSFNDTITCTCSHTQDDISGRENRPDSTDGSSPKYSDADTACKNSLADIAKAVSTGPASGYMGESYMNSSTHTDCHGHPSLPTAVQTSYPDAARASIVKTEPLASTPEQARSGLYGTGQSLPAADLADADTTFAPWFGGPCDRHSKAGSNESASVSSAASVAASHAAASTSYQGQSKKNRRWLCKPLSCVKQLMRGAKHVAGGGKQLVQALAEARKDRVCQVAAVGFAVGIAVADATIKQHVHRQCGAQ